MCYRGNKGGTPSQHTILVGSSKGAKMVQESYSLGEKKTAAQRHTSLHKHIEGGGGGGGRGKRGRTGEAERGISGGKGGGVK